MPWLCLSPVRDEKLTSIPALLQESQSSALAYTFFYVGISENAHGP